MDSLKIEEIDKAIVMAIVDIFWKYGCTFSDEIDWANRIFDDIVCPEEKKEMIAMEIEDAISRIEGNMMGTLFEGE